MRKLFMLFSLFQVFCMFMAYTNHQGIESIAICGFGATISSIIALQFDK